VTERQCRSVADQECTTVNEQKCSEVVEEQCQTIEEEECTTVEEEVFMLYYVKKIKAWKIALLLFKRFWCKFNAGM
jgi:hypothetical protein